MGSTVVVNRVSDRKRAGAPAREFLIALVVAVAALPGGLAVAASTSTELVPGTASVAGHKYGYWEAAWWVWRLSLPDRVANRSCFSARQPAGVWFLGGSDVQHGTLTRTCRVPAGRYLILLGPGAECSTVEAPPFHATTDAGLEHCVLSWWRRHQGGEDVTLDGNALMPQSWFVGPVLFDFRMPAHNNYLRVPGRTRGRSGDFGTVSILRPLSPGTHMLIKTQSYTHPSSFGKVIYKLTVG
jgi:hypothetical protein